MSLPEAQSARYDTAQDFSGATLDGELRRDGWRERKLLLQRRTIGDLGRYECRELAHPIWQLLFPDRAEVFHDRGLHDRFFAGLQHASHRDRHATQCVELRNQPTETFGAAGVGFWPNGTNQFKHEIERFEETFRTAALVSQFASGLLPGTVDLAQDVVIGHKSILEHDFIEILLTAHLIDRIDLDTARRHVHEKLCKTMSPVLIGRRRRTKQRD